MGLDCSHGAFTGSYGRYNNFRRWVCDFVGGSYPPHDYETEEQSLIATRFILENNGNEDPAIWKHDFLDPRFWYLNVKNKASINIADYPGLKIFFSTGDYFGNFIKPDECILVIEDLQKVLNTAEYDTRNKEMVETLETFIRGLKKAKRSKKGLRFE